ncbi:MAG: RNA 3'-terminal phosphate cyclase [Myxococcota bacterium]
MWVLTIDGSEGEGGGQVLRTALALSAVTGTPFRIEGIRARRSRPGLLRQHLTGVRAVAEVCGAEVEGDRLGSAALTFAPGPVRAGRYHWAVGTAGSAGLVLQAALPPLLAADGPSELVVEGGTHNPASPPGPFLEAALVPLLCRMGPRVALRTDRAGFYPAGGGQYTVSVAPAPLSPLALERRGEVELVPVAAVSNLSRKIAARELDVVRQGLGLEARAGELRELASPGPGNAVWIAAEAEAVTEVFTAFGRKGVSAEAVAAEALAELAAWRRCDVPVGEHLADQLLVPLALAGGGTFRTVAPSLHTRTNAALIARFLPVRFEVTEEGGGAYRITVHRS